jgi:hypothetical protein
MNESWYKIVLTDDDVSRGHISTVQGRSMARLIQSGWPNDFGFFLGKHDLTNHETLIYFSPLAAALCADIINDYSGEPCEQPNRSEAQSLGGHGDADERLLR